MLLFFSKAFIDSVSDIHFLVEQNSSRSPNSYFKRVPKSSAIKVIDFGSTTYKREDQSYIVSTRHYRAPEVILGIYKFYGKKSYILVSWWIIWYWKYQLYCWFWQWLCRTWLELSMWYMERGMYTGWTMHGIFYS